MKFQENRYPLAGGNIAAKEFGDTKSSAVTLMFLHGWLDNAASFDSTIEALSRSNFDLHYCAIDLPGHGLSFHKPEGNFYPFHDYVDDLYQLLTNHFSTQKIIFVGHSLGALIASCFSAAFPELVQGLVQIEGVGPLPELEHNTVERLREGVISRKRILSKPTRSFKGLEPVIQRRAKLNQLDGKLIEPVIIRGTQKKQGEYFWRHDIKLQCHSVYRMSFRHADEVLKQITCPHVVVLGESGYPELKSRIKQLDTQQFHLKTVKGGHHCHLENPIDVSEAILGLVNKT